MSKDRYNVLRISGEPSGETTSRQVPCKLCGQPVTLHYPLTGDNNMDIALNSISGWVAHQVCADNWHKSKEQRIAARRIEEKSHAWEQLCPPLYQDSDQWIRTKKAASTIHLKEAQKALSWAYGPKGLFLHGKQTQTGKTTIAWVICKGEFNVGRFVVALTHAELSVQATLQAQGENQSRWARFVRDCDLLFIDDLGKSRFTTVDGRGRAAEEFLFDLFDHRIKYQLPTLFTCNFENASDLLKCMSPDRGEPFVRRVGEYCEAVGFDRYV